MFKISFRGEKAINFFFLLCPSIVLVFPTYYIHCDISFLLLKKKKKNYFFLIHLTATDAPRGPSIYRELGDLQNSTEDGWRRREESYRGQENI